MLTDWIYEIKTRQDLSAVLDLFERPAHWTLPFPGMGVREVGGECHEVMMTYQV